MNDGSAVSRMDVIVAGAIAPPNPAELIESRTMEALLGSVRDRYDLVVIDTAPLMLVSDSIALLTKVDGVLLVSRMGVNRRDTAEQIRDTLAGLRAPLLGVIANCVPTRPAARYRYGYGESPESEGRRLGRHRRDPGLASHEPGSQVFEPNA
jgi:Mrp family chromosome partitioning ATPase